MTPYQAPYLARPDELLPLPPVAARAALAAAQLINYHERFAFSAKMLRLLGRVFRDGSRHLAAECVTSLPRHFLDTSQTRLGRATSLQSALPAVRRRTGECCGAWMTCLRHAL